MFRTLLVAVAVVSVVSVAHATNTWSLSWHRHANVTTSDETLEDWHNTSTDRIQDDGDGNGTDDVCADAEIVMSGATDTGWTYTGGDEVIDNETEMTAAHVAMTCDGALLKTSYDGSNGTTYPDGKILLFVNDALFSAITLGHEVGHKAGLGHESIAHNIMTPSTSAETIDGAGGAAARSYLNQSQAYNYEGH
jgi:hypothetical protein